MSNRSLASLLCLLFSVAACQSSDTKRSSASVSYSSCHNNVQNIGISKEGGWPQWELVADQFDENWVVAEIVESGKLHEEYEASETPAYGGDLRRSVYKNVVVRLYKPEKVDQWTFGKGALIATVDNMTCTYHVQRTD